MHFDSYFLGAFLAYNVNKMQEKPTYSFYFYFISFILSMVAALSLYSLWDDLSGFDEFGMVKTPVSDEQLKFNPLIITVSRMFSLTGFCCLIMSLFHKPPCMTIFLK